MANTAQLKSGFYEFKRQNSEIVTLATTKSARDALSMKIMTILALLYLPSSVVLAVFVPGLTNARLATLASL